MALADFLPPTRGTTGMMRQPASRPTSMLSLLSGNPDFSSSPGLLQSLASGPTAAGLATPGALNPDPGVSRQPVIGGPRLPSSSTSDAQPHPKFFEQGGAGQRILGFLSNFALNYSASQGDPGALLTLRTRADQQAELRRARADHDEWVWREDYKRQHPDDQFSQYIGAAGIDPASPQGQSLYRQKAESMAAPPLMAVDGFDPQGNPTKTFMPRPTLASGANAATSAAPDPLPTTGALPMFGGGKPTPQGPAIGTIRGAYRFKGGNPNDRNSWEPVGGTAPQAPTPFLIPGGLPGR